jgi:hypothetical protein
LWFVNLIHLQVATGEHHKHVDQVKLSVDGHKVIPAWSTFAEHHRRDEQSQNKENGLTVTTEITRGGVAGLAVPRLLPKLWQLSGKADVGEDQGHVLRIQVVPNKQTGRAGKGKKE